MSSIEAEAKVVGSNAIPANKTVKLTSGASATNKVKDNVEANVDASVKARESSNFREHVNKEREINALDVGSANKASNIAGKGTTSNGYKVSNGADTVIAKTDLDHPIVQSRINVQKAGWDHVVDRHFSDKNASQFTISQSELKTILQSNEVSKVPISRVIDSADGPRYERVITFDKHIGVDKFSKSPTNTMTILTDAKGNLITTTPGRIK